MMLVLSISTSSALLSCNTTLILQVKLKPPNFVSATFRDKRQKETTSDVSCHQLGFQGYPRVGWGRQLLRLKSLR